MQKRNCNQLVVDGTREPRMQQLPDAAVAKCLLLRSYRRYQLARGRFGSSWTDKSAFLLDESNLLLSRRSKLIARKRKPVALRRNLHKITHRCFTVQLQPAWIYSNRTFVIVEDRFEWFHRSQLPNKKYSEIFFSLFYLFYNNNSYEYIE